MESAFTMTEGQSHAGPESTGDATGDAEPVRHPSEPPSLVWHVGVKEVAQGLGLHPSELIEALYQHVDVGRIAEQDAAEPDGPDLHQPLLASTVHDDRVLAELDTKEEVSKPDFRLQLGSNEAADELKQALLPDESSRAPGAFVPANPAQDFKPSEGHSHAFDDDHHAIDIPGARNIDSFCPRLSFGTNAASTVGSYAADDQDTPRTATLGEDRQDGYFTDAASLDAGNESWRPESYHSALDASEDSTGAVTRTQRTVKVRAHLSRFESPMAPPSLASSMHNGGEMFVARCLPDIPNSEEEHMIFFTGDPDDVQSRMQFLSDKSFVVTRQPPWSTGDANESPSASATSSVFYLTDLHAGARSRAPPLQDNWEGLTFQLPSDIVNIGIESGGTQAEPELDVSIKRRVPLIGFALLASALLCTSVSGAALKLQDPAGPFLKSFWRSVSTLICCLPWLLHGWLTDSDTFDVLRNYELLSGTILAGIGNAALGGFFVLSLAYTTLPHALVLGTCPGILIVLSRIALRLPTTVLEIVGSLIGMVGVVVTASAADFGSDHAADIIHVGPFRVRASNLGDMFALLSSCGGVLYLMQSKAIRPRINLSVFATGITLVSLPIFFACAFLLDAARPTFDRDPVTGLLGFWSARQWQAEVLAGPVVVVFGIVGYVVSMKYLDPLVVAVVMLLEPAIGTIMGVGLGVDDWPGWITWVGAAITCLGTLMVACHRNSQEAIKVRITGMNKSRMRTRP